MLDTESWKKTKKEYDAGTLLSPLYPSTLPADVVLLPLWEQHGSATEPSCRNIDDGLTGKQNSGVGLYSVHRPYTVANIAAAGRKASERFPTAELGGFTSDFGGSYRQVPASPSQAEKFGVTTWDPDKRCIVVFLAVAQILGSRAAPSNFSRYSDWCSFVVAALFLIATGQCVDDLICIERWNTVRSARAAWLDLANLCGWDIPLEKSPPASQIFGALGIFVDLSEIPLDCGYIMQCPTRVPNIGWALEQILACKRFGSGHAASLCGKLVYTTSAFVAKLGRAMLRPFRRRCHELRSNLNPQIIAAAPWWTKSLKSAPPRPIPWKIDQADVVITYSDGDGSSAGVGVAIWSQRLTQPEAGRIDVPVCIRKLWAAQRASTQDDLFDIQEIEGIGPSLALTTWPSILRNFLWLHFIDNNGAFSSLVRGGSSVLGTDSIVAFTWSHIISLGVLPWFDRVDTKSNPVDGISRDVLSEPWEIVSLQFPGASLSKALREGTRLVSRDLPAA